MRALGRLEVPVVGLVVGQHLCTAIERPACSAVLKGSILDHVGGAGLSTECARGCDNCGGAQKGEGAGELHDVWFWGDDVMMWSATSLR
jgi:hypothetical protein